MTVFDTLKQAATREVRSHGAFGEAECRSEIDVDLLIQLVAKECALMVKDTPCYSNTDHYYIADEIEERFGVTL